jgi:hypothetical protein
MWFIVTLCGADSWRGLLMRQGRIATGDFPLGPKEVTMNHIMKREKVLGDYKGQKPLATPMLMAKHSCPYCAFCLHYR